MAASILGLVATSQALQPADLGFWSSVLTTWSHLSDGVQGVIVGGVLSFIATVVVTTVATIVANRHARNLQEKQLRFESQERRTEREHSLRCDVYLVAAEAITDGVSALAQSCNLEFADEEIRKAGHKLGVAISRVQTVAGPETLQEISRFSRAFTNASARLQLARANLKAKQPLIEGNSKMLEATTAESSRLLEMMKAWNRDGTGGEQRWQAIQQQSDYAHSRIESLFAEGDRLRIDMTREQLEILKSYPEVMTPLQPHFRSSLLAIRKELGLEDASQVLDQELERADAEGQALLTALISKLESMIEDDERELAETLKQQEVTKATPNEGS
jgi:hypothetical protein